jgi:uncharacterized OsmC-like protein
MEITKNIDVTYTGSLRTEATHLKSNSTLTTDAPTDNNGKGEKFSPTDLIAASLASCILTVVGIHYDKKGVSLSEIQCEVQKIMASNPRRIDTIKIKFDFGENDFTSSDYKIIEKLALTCPVSNSLSDALKIETNIPSFL